MTCSADGRLWGYSEALGLEFWWVRDESPSWHKGVLRFRDPVSGEFLPTFEEVLDAADRAEAAEERAETAEARAQSAEARMAEMEAELRRLRDE